MLFGEISPPPRVEARDGSAVVPRGQITGWNAGIASRRFTGALNLAPAQGKSIKPWENHTLKAFASLCSRLTVTDSCSAVALAMSGVHSPFLIASTK